MVGITVGLVTVLVITQTLSVFQGNRGGIVAGADAQENGLFAMQIISGDIRGTGAGAYSSGTVSKTMFTCTNVCSYDSSNGGGNLYCSNPGGTGPVGTSPIAAMSGQPLNGATPTYTLAVPLSPIIIESQPAGISPVVAYAPGSDVITLRSASRFIGSVPTLVSGAVNLGAPLATLGVKRTFGFSVNDLALITDGTNCSVFKVTALDAAGATLTHGAETAFNPAVGAWSGMANGGAFGNTAQIYNLGTSAIAAVSAKEYSVSGPNGSSLQLREVKSGSAASALPLVLADGIVALRAQYGVASNNASPVVAGWEGTDSADWSSTWAPGVLSGANEQLIRAVRILVVARAPNRESTEVTPACTTSGYTDGPCPSGGTTQSDTTLPAINLANLAWAAGGEWKHYRYKVYTTVVPLRNVLWNGSWSNQVE